MKSLRKSKQEEGEESWKVGTVYEVERTKRTKNTFKFNVSVLLIIEMSSADLDILDLDSGCQVTSSRDGRNRTREASLSQSVTSFGASLYRQLTSGNLDNLIFSPFSVFTVLSVGPQQGVHQTLHNAVASLPTSLDPDTNLTLRVANAAYYNPSRITVLPGFSRNIQRLYGGALKPFEDTNPEAAINSWVEQVTDGMIQNFLPPGHINSDTVLMLLNAVFFEGFWVNEFSTGESDFTTANGTVVRVPMMHRSEGSISFKNIQALNAQVIELPYKGNRFSLFLIMPNTWDGLMNLERRLDGQPTVSAQLFLPKFRLSTGKELNDHLKAMGLRTAFSRRADFRRISLRPLSISKVIHKAIIEVTETGSRAAAVTSVELVLLSLPVQVNVNKPFVFILRDKTSGLNLFMGRVTDPSQE
ncbi:hypothetical protein C0Q70_20962 [Pomacea canaliculata]|uniref:Serpin domain-containing protein n=2 Tax=Pomacea canaliculata TaxID=400727 RepID=A0A2T7NB69_POMCA|nr:hypothetical protein C0Q70_20962 [Pomacea canaliculata]